MARGKHFDPYDFKHVQRDLPPGGDDRHPHPARPANRAADYNDGYGHGRSANDRVATDSEQRNQFVENEHGPGYDNDASGWVRGTTGRNAPTGHDETGMDYPGGFDHSDKAPRFNSSKGNTWPRQPSDEPTDRQHGDRRHGTNQGRFQGGMHAVPGGLSTKPKVRGG